MTLAEIHQRTGGDKGTTHAYLPVYEELLAPYREKPCNVLEVGLFWGDSLRMFERYFHLGTVHGIDLCDQPLGMADLRPMIAEGTHNIHLLDAASPEQMQQHFGSMTFDVVIEDASHDVTQQLAIYHNLRPRLNPGALYVIEDVQDLDRDRKRFETMDPTVKIEIKDLRRIKNRYDDVLAIISVSGSSACGVLSPQ